MKYTIPELGEGRFLQELKSIMVLSRLVTIQFILLEYAVRLIGSKTSQMVRLDGHTHVNRIS